MLVAMAIAYSVFSTAADAALGAARMEGRGGGGILTSTLLQQLRKRDTDEIPLYVKVRRMVFLRTMELLLWFVLLNFVGVVAARLFVRASDIEDEQWTWMTTVYWAIQTTTTIGTFLW